MDTSKNNNSKAQMYQYNGPMEMQANHGQMQQQQAQYNQQYANQQYQIELQNQQYAANGQNVYVQQYPSQVPAEVRKQLQEDQEQDTDKSSFFKLVSQHELSPDRKGFIIKTYSILFTMLAFTAGVCAAVQSHDDLKMWSVENGWLYMLSVVIVIFMMCYMPCMYKFYRRVPINYIIMAVFCLAHSWVLAHITIFYKQSIVIAAALITMGMFIGLTLYACCTKTDMTYMGGLLSTLTMSAVLILILFSFFMSKIGYLIMIGVLICLLSLWIVHDTQLIIGGKHKAAELQLDDYIVGAMIIYSDILLAFMYILQLLGITGGNS